MVKWDRGGGGVPLPMRRRAPQLHALSCTAAARACLRREVGSLGAILGVRVRVKFESNSDYPSHSRIIVDQSGAGT